MSVSTGPVVVAGECLVDVIRDAAGEVREVSGGGPFTTARTVARLGVHATFLGCVSRDRRGERLMDQLSEDGVDLSRVVRTDAPTTIAHATLDGAGAATYRFEIEGTAAPALEADAALRALDPVPAVVHVGTLGLVFEPSGSSLERMVHETSSETLVMLDPNARPSAILDLDAWRERIRRIAQRANVIRASTDDLQVLAAHQDVLGTARELGSDGAVVLVSDGPRAVLVVMPGREAFELPVPRVSVVDTVGAGDAFGGGFLASWVSRGLASDALHDRGALEAAVRAGITVAALTCGRQGADPPRLAELGPRGLTG
jgi:fructokinase